MPHTLPATSRRQRWGVAVAIAALTVAGVGGSSNPAQAAPPVDLGSNVVVFDDSMPTAQIAGR